MKEKTLNRIFILLLAGLFILRFPVSILPRFGLLPISNETARTICQIGTYLLTAIMILLKRNSLEKYHIDRFTLALLILAPAGVCVSEYLLWGRERVQLSAWVNAGVSVGLLLALLIWRPVMPKRGTKETLRWVGIAVAGGLIYSVAGDYFIHFQRGPRSLGGAPMPQMLLVGLVGIFIQLGNAAAIEEPLFRGFLWGALREHGWKDSRIWLFQALLFMLAHIYYLGSANYSFFLVVLMGALMLGAIAWKSKSIGGSMIAHSISNGLGGMFPLLFSW